MKGRPSTFAVTIANTVEKPVRTDVALLANEICLGHVSKLLFGDVCGLTVAKFVHELKNCGPVLYKELPDLL